MKTPDLGGYTFFVNNGENILGHMIIHAARKVVQESNLSLKSVASLQTSGSASLEGPNSE